MKLSLPSTLCPEVLEDFYAYLGKYGTDPEHIMLLRKYANQHQTRSATETAIYGGCTWWLKLPYHPAWSRGVAARVRAFSSSPQARALLQYFPSFQGDVRVCWMVGGKSHGRRIEATNHVSDELHTLLNF